MFFITSHRTDMVLESKPVMYNIPFVFNCAGKYKPKNNVQLLQLFMV